jgi:predicted transcriptional regulator
MQLSEVMDVLEATVISGEDIHGIEIKTACGSDMMSDALAFVKDQGMLLTGLLNPQVVRTADMLDMRCIVFVRGKQPGTETIELARERGIVLLSTGYRMFTACGRLYAAGLGGGCDET